MHAGGEDLGILRGELMDFLDALKLPVLREKGDTLVEVPLSELEGVGVALTGSGGLSMAPCCHGWPECYGRHGLRRGEHGLHYLLGPQDPPEAGGGQ